MNTMSVTRQRLPFGRVVSTRTVWLVAGLWAPLVGLVAALGLRGGPAANWLELTLLLIRLVLSYGAANKAFASRTRWRAMAWMASGAAIIVVVLAPLYFGVAIVDGPGGGTTFPWQDITTCAALAAAWYLLLAVFLYRPAGRSSHEQADCAVGLAGLWVALPILATNLTLTHFTPAYLALATTTFLLFGYDVVPILNYGGLGGWIQGCHSGCFLLGVHLALVGLLPIAVALLILLRIISRRRWVRLVEDGRISGWRLMDATIPRSAGIPVLTGDGQGAVKVLARISGTADPFRAVDVEPVALVAVSPGGARRRLETPAETGE
jgi:hypothetical protein